MIYQIVLCVCVCLSILITTCELKGFRCVQDEVDVQPLVLTELINKGEIAEAQSKAFVQIEDFRDIISYAGFLQVSKEYDSNLFFWYFPSQLNVNLDPVILWLQGGPGLTSLVGLFLENGPFQLENKFDIRLRMYSWTKRFSVVYVDNPVGTGYSYTRKGGYRTNQTIIAQDLHAALKQFFKLFPNIAKNDFYIMGEAYGGKYAISLAALIDHTNAKRKKKVHLRGIAIGSAFCDPVNQIAYGDYLYEVGLIDHNARERFYFLENCIKEHIKNNKWVEAYQTFDYLIGGDAVPETLYKNLTGLENMFNYVTDNIPRDQFDIISYYINLEELRKALHVGFIRFNTTNPVVEQFLREDFMKSIINSLPPLLRSYKVLFFNGQLDVLSGYDMTEDMLYNMEHEKAAQFQNVTRCIWRVGNQVAGYAKNFENLTQVMVRNAGHLIPTDQPKWTFNMIVRFIENINFCS
ncbi:hypothetical protein Trydic_g11426 [Trypoxylus dichotomus]